MNVRCKVRVTQVVKSCSNYGQGPVDSNQVVMTPVAGDGNSTWAKYTPNGEIKLYINNPEAFAAFEVGRFYFVDFAPAEPTEAEEKK